MKQSKEYCDLGWISPNGEYYGLSDFEILYGHIAIADALWKDYGFSGNSPDKWLESEGWIKQKDNVIVLNDNQTLTLFQLQVITNLIACKHKEIIFIKDDETWDWGIIN